MPELIREANLEGLKRSLRDAHIRLHEGVLQRIVTWASNAASNAAFGRNQKECAYTKRRRACGVLRNRSPRNRLE